MMRKKLKLFCLGLLTLTILACSSNSNKMQTPIDSTLNKLRQTPDSLVSIISIDRIDRFYQVKRGDIIKDSININNSSINDAVIERINALCDCTTVDFTKNSVIKSRDSLAINFNITTDDMNYGFNHRTINLLGNFYPFYKNVNITILVR